MKTKNIFGLPKLLALCGLFVCHNAFAFYNSSTGRWINRDPLREVGVKSLQIDSEEAADLRDKEESISQTEDPLYAFVRNDSQDLIDNLGLTVYLQAHPVTLRMNHSKVTMVVGCGSRWLGNPSFTHPMPGQPGQFYATIGAGPVHRLLVSNLNRERDIQLWRNIFSATISPPGGTSDDDFIGQLIAADAKYPDNLPYAWFPTRNGRHYNSNGYASGILLFVTSSMPPRPPRTPGFRRPVPDQYFQ